MSSKQIRSGAKAPGHRRHIVGRLMGYIKRGYKARFIIVLVCILVSAIANVAGSLFLGSLIDDYITPLLGAADPDFSGLVRALVMMGCLFLVGALCAYAYNRNMIVVSQGVQKTIRDDLFGHMQTLPIKYFDTHAHGDVMSVYTNDVDTLRQMFAQSIPQVINSSMTILVTFLGMLFTNALLTVVVLVCVCFALVVTRFLAGRSGRYFLRQQSTLGALNGYIEEMINGQKVVKVFCHEQEAQDGFDRVNDEMFHSADKAHTYASILMPIMVNIGNVQYVIVAMVGGALALSGVDTTITLGVIASFLQLSKSFSNPINQISQQFNSIIMALAGAERIFALMDEEPEEDHGTVTLVNVSYDKEGHQLEESEKRTNLWAWRVPHSTDMVMVPVREEADGSFTELKAPEAGWLPEGFEAPKGGAHAGTFGDLTPGEMVKTPRFWVLIVTFAFAATAGTLLVGKVASIAAVQLFADPTSAAAVALGGVVGSVNTCANLVGRLSFGQIIDKLGAYKSLLISLVVTIVALVIMSMSFTQSMFFVALALLGFSFGALLVIYPPLTGGAFGTSNIGVNYGIMFLGYAASTWISQPITAVLYHAEAGSAAYQQSFYGAIVIAAIAVVLTVYMMVSDSKKKSA